MPLGVHEGIKSEILFTYIGYPKVSHESQRKSENHIIVYDDRELSRKLRLCAITYYRRKSLSKKNDVPMEDELEASTDPHIRVLWSLLRKNLSESLLFFLLVDSTYDDIDHPENEDAMTELMGHYSSQSTRRDFLIEQHRRRSLLREIIHSIKILDYQLRCLRKSNPLEALNDFAETLLNRAHACMVRRLSYRCFNPIRVLKLMRPETDITYGGLLRLSDVLTLDNSVTTTLRTVRLSNFDAKRRTNPQFAGKLFGLQFALDQIALVDHPLMITEDHLVRDFLQSYANYKRMKEPDSEQILTGRLRSLFMHAMNYRPAGVSRGTRTITKGGRVVWGLAANVVEHLLVGSNSRDMDGRVQLSPESARVLSEWRAHLDERRLIRLKRDRDVLYVQELMKSLMEKYKQIEMYRLQQGFTATSLHVDFIKQPQSQDNDESNLEAEIAAEVEELEWAHAFEALEQGRIPERFPVQEESIRVREIALRTRRRPGDSKLFVRARTDLEIPNTCDNGSALPESELLRRRCVSSVSVKLRCLVNGEVVGETNPIGIKWPSFSTSKSIQPSLFIKNPGDWTSVPKSAAPQDVIMSAHSMMTDGFSPELNEQYINQMYSMGGAPSHARLPYGALHTFVQFLRIVPKKFEIQIWTSHVPALKGSFCSSRRSRQPPSITPEVLHASIIKNNSWTSNVALKKLTFGKPSQHSTDASKVDLDIPARSNAYLTTNAPQFHRFISFAAPKSYVGRSQDTMKFTDPNTMLPTAPISQLSNTAKVQAHIIGNQLQEEHEDQFAALPTHDMPTYTSFPERRLEGIIEGRISWLETSNVGTPALPPPSSTEISQMKQKQRRLGVRIPVQLLARLDPYDPEVASLLANAEIGSEDAANGLLGLLRSVEKSIASQTGTWARREAPDFGLSFKTNETSGRTRYRLLRKRMLDSNRETGAIPSFEEEAKDLVVRTGGDLFLLETADMDRINSSRNNPKLNRRKIDRALQSFLAMIAIREKALAGIRKAAISSQSAQSQGAVNNHSHNLSQNSNLSNCQIEYPSVVTEWRPSQEEQTSFMMRIKSLFSPFRPLRPPPLKRLPCDSTHIASLTVHVASLEGLPVFAGPDVNNFGLQQNGSMVGSSLMDLRTARVTSPSPSRLQQSIFGSDNLRNTSRNGGATSFNAALGISSARKVQNTLGTGYVVEARVDLLGLPDDCIEPGELIYADGGKGIGKEVRRNSVDETAEEAGVLDAEKSRIHVIRQAFAITRPVAIFEAQKMHTTLLNKHNSSAAKDNGWNVVYINEMLSVACSSGRGALEPSKIIKTHKSITINLFDERRLDNSAAGQGKDDFNGAARETIERRYLGCVTIPWTAIVTAEGVSISGEFTVDCPDILIGYRHPAELKNRNERDRGRNSPTRNRRNNHNNQNLSLPQPASPNSRAPSPANNSNGVEPDSPSFVFPDTVGKRTNSKQQFRSGTLDGISTNDAVPLDCSVKFVVTMMPLLKCSLTPILGPIPGFEDRSVLNYCSSWLVRAQKHCSRSRCFGVNLKGQSVLVCRFVRSISPTDDILPLGSLDDFALERCARFVACIPAIIQRRVSTAGLDLWLSVEEMARIKSGNQIDKAHMLCGFFLSVDEEAGRSPGRQTEAILEEKLRESEKKYLYIDEISAKYHAQKQQIKVEIEASKINPATGERMLENEVQAAEKKIKAKLKDLNSKQTKEVIELAKQLGVPQDLALHRMHAHPSMNGVYDLDNQMLLNPHSSNRPALQNLNNEEGIKQVVSDNSVDKDNQALLEDPSNNKDNKKHLMNPSTSPDAFRRSSMDPSNNEPDIYGVRSFILLGSSTIYGDQTAFVLRLDIKTFDAEVWDPSTGECWFFPSLNTDRDPRSALARLFCPRRGTVVKTTGFKSGLGSSARRQSINGVDASVDYGRRTPCSGDRCPLTAVFCIYDNNNLWCCTQSCANKKFSSNSSSGDINGDPVGISAIDSGDGGRPLFSFDDETALSDILSQSVDFDLSNSKAWMPLFPDHLNAIPGLSKRNGSTVVDGNIVTNPSSSSPFNDKLASLMSVSKEKLRLFPSRGVLNEAGEIESVQPRFFILSPPEDDRALAKEVRLRVALIAAIIDFRNEFKGLNTTRFVEETRVRPINDLISKLEMYRQTARRGGNGCAMDSTLIPGLGKRQASVTLDMVKEIAALISKNATDIAGPSYSSGDVFGFPINMSTVNTDAVVEKVFQTGIHEIGNAESRFAVVVKVFSLPGGFFSTWVTVICFGTRIGAAVKNAQQANFYNNMFDMSLGEGRSIRRFR